MASTKQRNDVGKNLPDFLSNLSDDDKRDARYLSKFVGATAIGLFDAALNYIWNEVVLNLRKKATIYGIDLFFDASVGGERRQDFKNEKDLEGLKDSVLLDTCLKLQLLSDVTYKKLIHILTMRNDVAASHPNVERIGGFELLGWLETCIKDVLQDRPSDSAISVNKLIKNLKGLDSPINTETVAQLSCEIKQLASVHASNLLLTLFGIYVDDDSSTILRKNISFIAKSVWDCSIDDTKNQIGIKLDSYTKNLDKTKIFLAKEFLDIVDGHEYESLNSRMIKLDIFTNNLLEAHCGMNNFYTEPPIMRDILMYCKDAKDIPNSLLPKMTYVVVKCRIGNGAWYCDGVSPSGGPLYEKFLSVLDDNGIIKCILAFYKQDIISYLDMPNCKKQIPQILQVLETRAISERIQESLHYLKSAPNVKVALYSKEFKDLTSSFLIWDKK